eukprot:6196668-Pleurochrysis_carterae.AAC.1
MRHCCASSPRPAKRPTHCCFEQSPLLFDQDFLTSLAEIVKRQYGADEREPALVTRARHVQHLTACVKALDAFVELAQLGDGAPLDIATEELRTAVNELGKITGRVDVEELLDVIFRDFCIG